MYRVTLASGLALVWSASCRPALPAPSTRTLTPQRAEGIPECSRTVSVLVFATRIDRCPAERASQVLRRLDHINTSAPWGEYVGRQEDVKALRDLGCPTAVLCTDANAYGTARETLGEDAFLKRYRAILDAATPAGSERTR